MTPKLNLYVDCRGHWPSFAGGGPEPPTADCSHHGIIELFSSGTGYFQILGFPLDVNNHGQYDRDPLILYSQRNRWMGRGYSARHHEILRAGARFHGPCRRHEQRCIWRLQPVRTERAVAARSGAVTWVERFMVELSQMYSILSR